MIELNKIFCEDCLVGMQRIPDGSVDAIICDLPYGTTDCAWDGIIPFDKLWEQYHRICKPSAVVALFGIANMKEWRYDWIWHKNSSAGFIHAHNRPLKDYEDTRHKYSISLRCTRNGYGSVPLRHRCDDWVDVAKKKGGAE